MNFLSVSALWFALTIPVVIVFYLLKRRRNAYLVSSTLLWQRYFAETQANAPFQKLRRNLLLFLQLLILILAVLALARPYFSNHLPATALQVLVMDISASMQSVDVSPSRFELAKKKARELVDALRDTDQMIVVAAGASTAVRQSPTSEKALLRRAIASIEVTDGPTRLLEALELAETLVRDHPSSEIHLISDGAVSDLADWGDPDLPLRFHQVGKRGNNLGIVSMDVRPNPEDSNSRAIFSNVINFSTNDFQVIAELRFNERMLESRALTLEGGGAASLAFIAPQKTNGVFTLNLLTKDDLAIDNSAHIVSLLPKPAKVLMFSRGNRFLEKALRASREMELIVTEDSAFSSDEFELVILDNLAPKELPTANLMVINLAPTNWFSSNQILDSPAVIDWRNDHPLLRFVSFDEVQIAKAIAVPSPFWGESLVESSQSSLILAGEQSGQRRLWIGFDTLASTWPLRVSFPMFMANAIDWLNPSLSRGQALNIQVGKPIEVPFESQEESITIIRPSGKKEEVALRHDLGRWVYGNTSSSGIYQVGDKDKGFAFAANLLDAAESDTSPRSSLSVSGGMQIEANVEAMIDLEIWRWIALGAFLILLFEWWYFHRRTA